MLSFIDLISKQWMDKNRYRFCHLLRERMSQNDGREGILSHFLDSGAFSLQSKAMEYSRNHRCGKWDYYDSDGFWKYMKDYAAFIKKYQVAIDLYTNMDVIGNPYLTWRNQKYLEKEHQLSPIPVVHYRTDLKWLNKYVRNGYEIIGIGGLVGKTMQISCQEWLDDCFRLVCPGPKYLPTVKLHGFGVSSYNLLIRYPWWSVDSSSWAKIGAFGGIIVPHYRGGRFVFSESPYVMKVSERSKNTGIFNSHYLSSTPAVKEIVRKWLDEIGVPLGTISSNEKAEEKGVLNDHSKRRSSCIHYFNRLQKELPKWPWPFKNTKRRTLGVF